MRGFFTAAPLLLAPALAGARTIDPSIVLASSTSFHLLQSGRGDMPMDPELMFHVEVHEASEPCGTASITVNGESLPEDGRGTLTLGHGVAVTAHWTFTCLLWDNQPYQQVLQLWVDSVNGEVGQDLGFSARFHQVKPLWIVDDATATPNPATDIPQEQESVAEDDLDDLEDEDWVDVIDETEGSPIDIQETMMELDDLRFQLALLQDAISFKEEQLTWALNQQGLNNQEEEEKDNTPDCSGGFQCALKTFTRKIASIFTAAADESSQGGGFKWPFPFPGPKNKGHCPKFPHHGNHTHGNHTFPHPPWHHPRHGNHTHGNHTFPPPPWHRHPHHGNHTHGNHTHGNHTFPRPPWRRPHHPPLFCKCPPPPPPHHHPGEPPKDGPPPPPPHHRFPGEPPKDGSPPPPPPHYPGEPPREGPPPPKDGSPPPPPPHYPGEPPREGPPPPHHHHPGMPPNDGSPHEHSHTVPTSNHKPTTSPLKIIGIAAVALFLLAKLRKLHHRRKASRAERRAAFRAKCRGFVGRLRGLCPRHRGGEIRLENDDASSSYPVDRKMGLVDACDLPVEREVPELSEKEELLEEKEHIHADEGELTMAGEIASFRTVADIIDDMIAEESRVRRMRGLGGQ
ncbi:hypothetical protein B0T19DRAFT_428072 [Cercophora scortea]|uniref:Uncharacterized protein n=1 Tax=Cercophora scortea TaxID=314031 RepID=A0AAE0IFK3_9PEZI|nr:hypothetical protein B0T19DRAFT_428072 [Cercophora scortea]